MESASHPSLLSMVASFGYLVAAIAAAAAAWASHGRRDGGIARQTRAWAGVAVAFVVFFAIRISAVDERLQAAGRLLLNRERGYGQRWQIQAPIAAFVVAVVALLLLLAWIRFNRRDRRVAAVPITLRLALVATWAMIGLIAFRLISLHSIDQLLYRGPHLNWIVDVGSTLTVIGAGIATWLVPGTTGQQGSLRPKEKRRMDAGRRH